MNPLLALFLVAASIGGTIALGFWLGHLFATCLSKTEPQTWAGRVIRDYRIWGVLGGLLMCATILGSVIHPLLTLGFLPLMCFAIISADHFETAQRRAKRRR